MDQEQKERYVRWQNYRINQLTFSINLFLGFAVVSLAYVVDLKLKNTTGLNTADLIIAIYWLSSSAMAGSIATLSRLLDFRYTTRKIKDSSTSDKWKAKLLGKITWGFFWVQVITYLAGGYWFIAKVAMQ
jgi:hypothetical protein